MSQQDRTRNDIKRAFLEVLSEKRMSGTTISEVARRAGVSRSTFYAHYGNVAALYEDIVSDMARDIAPLGGEPGCKSCLEVASDGRVPFCELIANPGRYAPVMREGRFLETLLSDRGLISRSSLISELMDSGLDFHQAYAILVFQMSGCYAAKKVLGSSERDWPRIKDAVDSFVASGLEGVSEGLAPQVP